MGQISDLTLSIARDVYKSVKSFAGAQTFEDIPMQATSWGVNDSYDLLRIVSHARCIDNRWQNSLSSACMKLNLGGI